MNVNPDDRSNISQVKGALECDGIATEHTGRTVAAIQSVLWDAFAAIASFKLTSGVSWEHIGTEHIVANVYVALRTSCFAKSKDTTPTFYHRSLAFLHKTYGGGMDHVLDSRPRAGTRAEPPATPVPSPLQPPRSRGNELHRTARNGSERRTAELLAEGKIDMEEGDCQGYTPLLMAAHYQHPGVVDMLLRAGANVSAVTDEGYTALGASVRQGNIAIAAMCVKAGADVNARYIDGRYPLYRVACDQNLAMATVLVEAGARADIPFTDGETALHAAATVGALGMVLLFIKAGVNVNVRMIGGGTALHKAAQYGHGGTVEALLAAGADPLLGYTQGADVLVPLDYAVAKGCADIVEYLLAAGKGIQGCGGESGGLNAFRYAARAPALDIMIALSDAGVVDDGGALLIATSNADQGCVRFLLGLWRERGDAKNPQYVNTMFSNQTLPMLGMTATRGGVTPLTLTIKQFQKYSSCKIVQHLIELGADTTLAVTVTDPGKPAGVMTPFEVVEECHGRYEKRSEDDFCGERLLAIGRMLHQAEAMRAASWLWPSFGTGATVTGTVGKVKGWTGETDGETDNAAFRLMLRRMKHRAGTSKAGTSKAGTSKLQIALLSHEARAARGKFDP